ncbi:MAG: PIN domain-containing protein [Sneathiellaceae bacterium]
MPVEMAPPFIDSNVILYLTSGDARKAGRAEQLLHAGGVVSVQVLDEVAHVARRKMAFTWPETRLFLDSLRRLVDVKPVTQEVHDLGLEIAERYRYSIWDGMIVGAAISAGCDILLSEDLQHGQVVEAALTIRNPFAAG